MIKKNQRLKNYLINSFRSEVKSQKVEVRSFLFFPLTSQAGHKLQGNDKVLNSVFV